MYFSKIFLSNHVRLFQYLIIFLAYWSITANAGNHREKHIPIEFKTDGQDLKPIINNSRFALIAIVPEDNPSFFEVKITLEDNTLSIGRNIPNTDPLRDQDFTGILKNIELLMMKLKLKCINITLGPKPDNFRVTLTFANSPQREKIAALIKWSEEGGSSIKWHTGLPDRKEFTPETLSYMRDTIWHDQWMALPLSHGFLAHVFEVVVFMYNTHVKSPDYTGQDKDPGCHCHSCSLRAWEFLCQGRYTPEPTDKMNMSVTVSHPYGKYFTFPFETAEPMNSVIIRQPSGIEKQFDWYASGKKAGSLTLNFPTDNPESSTVADARKEADSSESLIDKLPDKIAICIHTKQASNVHEDPGCIGRLTGCFSICCIQPCSTCCDNSCSCCLCVYRKIIARINSNHPFMEKRGVYEPVPTEEGEEEEDKF